MVNEGFGELQTNYTVDGEEKFEVTSFFSLGLSKNWLWTDYSFLGKVSLSNLWKGKDFSLTYVL